MAAADNIVIINASDEAMEFKNRVFMSEDGSKEALKKEPYDRRIADLLCHPREQQFPDCTVKNTLGYEQYNGCKVYTLRSDDYDKVILYVHGGGWVGELTPNEAELCDALVSSLNAKAYIPLYPLAPESNSTEAYKLMEGLYREILQEGKDIYFVGDSAGGNIILGLMYSIKAENIPGPEKIILIAPCADMTFTNKQIPSIEKRDPVLSVYGCARGAELWAGIDNLNTPKNSAVYADVAGYPDTMIIQGTEDILYADTMLLYRHMKNAGVKVTLVKGEGLWHVFPIFPIPERDKTVKLIREFCGCLER